MFSQQPRLRRCRTPVAVHQNSSIRLTHRQLERRVNKSRWVINGIAKYQCLEKRRQRIEYKCINQRYLSSKEQSMLTGCCAAQ